MRRPLLLVGIILVAAVVPAQAQAARVVVVTDFLNISVDSGLIPPAYLSQLLQQLLQRQAGSQWRVLAGDSVRTALRTRRYTPDDLVYPSKAAEIAQAVGADWVVTGRWTQLRIISRSTVEDPTTPSVRERDAFAIASVDIRVLDASSRRILLEERFTGHSTGGDLGDLLLAATDALHDAAVRIARL